MYEAEIQTLDILCDRTKNAVDVGAYTGIYTHELVPLSRHVHTYEPLPWFAKALRYLFANNTVTVREVALFNQNTIAILYTPRYSNPEENIDRFVDELSSLTQTFGSAHEQYPKRFIEVRQMRVPTVTLDSENLTNVGFMKIDVEGAEQEVLEGAWQTLKKYRPNLLIEIEERHRPGSTQDIPRYLDSLEYDGYFMVDNTLHTIQDFDVNALQQGKIFPGSRDLRHPKYIYNFIFVPAENQTVKVKLFQRLSAPQSLRRPFRLPNLKSQPARPHVRERLLHV